MNLRSLILALTIVAVVPVGLRAASADDATTETMVCKKALSSYLSPDQKTEWKDLADGVKYTELRAGKKNGNSPVGAVDLFVHVRALDGKGHVLEDTQEAIDSCCGGSAKKKPGAFELKAPTRIRKGAGRMLPVLEKSIEGMKEGGKWVVRIPHAQAAGKDLFYATPIHLEGEEDLYVEVSLLMVRPVR